MRSLKLSRETRKLFKVRRRFPWKTTIVLLSLVALFLAYTFYDSRQLRLETVRFSMPTLPKGLEGYTILHLSDIHEYSFGENGEALAGELGDTRPSIALISGGLTDENGSGEGFLQALRFLKEERVPCYYVLGEDDPPYMDFLEDGSFGIQELYAKAEELGAVYLNRPENLYEGDTGLWLMPASSLLLDTGSAIQSLNALEQTYLSDESAVKATGHSLEALLDSIEYRRQTVELFAQQLEPHTQNDLNIFLTHLPAMPEQYQSEATTAILHDADLILSGHNHGGYRLPVYGAWWVRNSQFPRGGLLPNRALVSGFSAQSGWNQYVSPGIGTGRSDWWSLRWLSTPTVTLIQLTRSVA